MTRTTRRPKASPKTLTIGVFGLGEASAKSIGALLEDYIGDAEAEFILPATRDHFKPAVSAVADYLAEHDIPFSVITDDTTSKARTLRDLAKEATAEEKATQPGIAMVNLLKDADDGRLLVLWNETLGEDDGGAYDAIEYADECGVPCFDLCNGLEKVNFGDDDEEPAAPDADTDDDNDEDDKEGDDPVSTDETLPPYKEAAQLGIRALRGFARDRKLASDRKIGGMSKDEVLDLLYDARPAAPAQMTLDDEVAAAARAVAGNGQVTTNTLAPAASGLVFMDIDDLASRIALRVKELIDA